VRATGHSTVADVGGVCAWSSTIHVPDSHLAEVFSQFHRVLGEAPPQP
jgi:hypothetical protein